MSETRATHATHEHGQTKAPALPLTYLAAGLRFEQCTRTTLPKTPGPSITQTDSALSGLNKGQTPIHSLTTHPFTHSHAHSFSRALARPLSHTHTHSLLHSLTRSLTLSLTHSHTHTLALALAHSLTAHSPHLRSTRFKNCESSQDR